MKQRPTVGPLKEMIRFCDLGLDTIVFLFEIDYV